MTGRNEKERELEHWQVLERSSGRKVAYVWRRWGFTPLPPGSYVVEILPQGYEALPLRWAEVEVTASHTTDVPVARGKVAGFSGSPLGG